MLREELRVFYLLLGRINSVFAAAFNYSLYSIFFMAAAAGAAVIGGSLTKHFAALAPQNPSIKEYHVAQKRVFTTF